MPTQDHRESEADFFNRVGWRVGDVIRGKEEFGEYWNIVTLKILWIGRKKVVTEEISKDSNTYGLEVFNPPMESASWSFHFRNWEKVKGESK